MMPIRIEYSIMVAPFSFFAQARKENPKPCHFMLLKRGCVSMGLSFCIAFWPYHVAFNDRPSFGFNFGRNVIVF